MSKRARIALGGILLTLMSANFGAYVYSLSLPKKGSYFGITGRWDDQGELLITVVDSNSPASKSDLRVGDKVVAVNSVKINPRMLDSDTLPGSTLPGTRDTVTIRRAGELRDVTIQTIPYGPKRFDPFYYINLLFPLTGWMVFLLRPDDKQAWLLALMLGTLTAVVGSRPADLPFSSEDKRLLLSVGGPTSFALENIRLIERTIEDARRRQELEAENEQRARELEGARQLQLSMLPKQIPQLPHLEIATYMKPAAEVGGDYYDFHLADDGTLTVAVGDATGHGLKAGTVVTAMKSLFRTFAAEPEIVPVSNQSSRVLKVKL